MYDGVRRYFSIFEHRIHKIPFHLIALGQRISVLLLSFSKTLKIARLASEKPCLFIYIFRILQLFTSCSISFQYLWSDFSFPCASVDTWHRRKIIFQTLLQWIPNFEVGLFEKYTSQKKNPDFFTWPRASKCSSKWNLKKESPHRLPFPDISGLVSTDWQISIRAAEQNKIVNSAFSSGAWRSLSLSEKSREKKYKER